jgi:GT2 family glycosyltransferase/glycosyltransferase involved in cell wall biosynthesis
VPLIETDLIPEESKVGKDGFFVVPIFGVTPQLSSLLDTLCKTLPSNFGIALFDDATPDYAELLDCINQGINGSEREVLLVKRIKNEGFVGNVNSAFEQLVGFDVILSNSDVVPAYNWFQPLYEAAKSSPLVASATCQTNNGTLASVSFPEPAIDFLYDLNAFGRDLESRSSYYPPLPTCVGHFVYFNAQALSVVGFFDEIYAPGYGEEVDWSQRAVRLGFRHVLATGSLAYHFGSHSFDKIGVHQRLRLQQEHENILAHRYPNYHESTAVFANSDRSQLSSSQLAAKAFSGKLHLRLDFTDIGPAYTGTGRVAIEIAKRISVKSFVSKIDVVVGSSDHIEFFANELGQEFNIFEFADIEKVSRADVVFRPMQVRSAGDLFKLFQMAQRQIVHQLDFIAYENSDYFDSASDWTEYRKSNDLAFALVDEVTYLSEFVQNQSYLLGLSCSVANQGTVIYAGTDHTKSEVPSLEDQDLHKFGQISPCKNDILLAGAAFAHKNRIFALRILDELITEHGFTGRLILIGPNPTNGSSLPDEAEYILRNRHISNSIVTLPWVSDELLGLIMASVGLVIYPTTSEGFGLIPFEAAALGTPCLASRAGSLGEILTTVDMKIDLANLAKSAATISKILSDVDLQTELLQQVNVVSSNFLWGDVVNRLYGAIEKVATLPQPSYKDSLWNSFTLNYIHKQEEIAAALEHQRKLKKEEEEIIAAELAHQTRLANSYAYKARHSKFGKLAVPQGSIRDQIIQLIIRILNRLLRSASRNK